MANENKNINELVSEDEDPTSELEALTWRRSASAARLDAGKESEARTHDLDGDETAGPADPAIAKLRSDLESRSETIDRLQFDIEQLHAKWIGLETEIKAREELTARIAGELDTERESSARKDKLLQKRDDTIKALKVEIGDREQQYRELAASNDELTKRIAAGDDTITELRRRYESDRSELEMLLHDEQVKSKRIVEKQSGQLASRDAQIEDLRSQLRRSETYADGIRQQLHDRIAACDELGAARDAVVKSLDEAEQRLSALSRELEESRAAVAAYDQEVAALKSAHSEEIRIIRFELGEAQETVSQHELISEQLTSDLISARGFKEELERMLSESEELRRAGVDKLEKELARLRADAQRHESELATKTEAINSLLAELAQKTQQIDSIGKLENVIHEIDDRMSERFEERGGGDRDRITRQLIGTIDEQELRFPLFKKRLTIGRTQQNDIQLKAPYVSRRHAVIVTEGERTRVIDWGSKNGVYVNSAQVTEHFLSNGDVVRIGTADFRYEERPKRDA